MKPYGSGAFWTKSCLCVPSQYGTSLVCLQPQSSKAPSCSAMKRNGDIFGANALWEPSQKGWNAKERAEHQGHAIRCRPLKTLCCSFIVHIFLYNILLGFIFGKCNNAPNNVFSIHPPSNCFCNTGTWGYRPKPGSRGQGTACTGNREQETACTGCHQHRHMCV